MVAAIGDSNRAYFALSHNCFLYNKYFASQKAHPSLTTQVSRCNFKFEISSPRRPGCVQPSLHPLSHQPQVQTLEQAVEISLNPTSSASPSRKKEDEEELTLSWGEKVFSKEEFR